MASFWAWLALWAALPVVVFLVLIWELWGRPWWKQWKRILACGRSLPGPPALLILGNMTDFGFNSISELIPLLYDMSLKYGNVLRLWMGPVMAVNLVDAKDIEILLSNVKYIDKSYFYKLIHPWVGQGLLTSTGEKWHKHRKIITPTFHFKILEQFIEVFNKQGDIFIANLAQHVGKGSFDVCPDVNLYTEYVICETAMGVDLMAQTEKERASKYISAVRSQGEIVSTRLFSPWLYSDTIFRLSPMGWKERKNLKIMHGLTREVISKRRDLLEKDRASMTEHKVDDLGRKRRLAFLDLLLLSTENGNALSENDIREEVDTFMFEGHDTTSSAICFAIYELSKHPEVQEKIFKELKGVNEGDTLKLSMESLNSLKNTEMVIKETLRIYPSVVLYGRSLKEDLPLVSGHSRFSNWFGCGTRGLPSPQIQLGALPVSGKDVIPAGTIINISPYAVHRNTEYFPDPEIFNPDNFLPEVVQRRHPYVYVPFSAGPRNCIGQKFAMLEIKSILSKIIWNFRLKSSSDFEVKLIYSVTLKSENGIQISVVPRNRECT